MKKSVVFLFVSLMIFGIGRVSASGLFTDVSPDSWYYPAVKNIATLGIMKGDTNGNFRPNDAVTRAELAQVIDTLNKNNTQKSTSSDENATINAISNTINSVVYIKTKQFSGAGVVIGVNQVLTARHVIEDGTAITVRTYDGTEYPGKVIKQENNDLAMIQIEPAKPLTPIKLADSVALGESVIAIGHPKWADFSVSKGIISKTDYHMGINTVYQTDAAIDHGNSGGALINESGQLLGIVTAKSPDIPLMGYAITFKDINSFLAR